MCGSMVDITLRLLRLGEEIKKIEETTGQKYNVRICYTQGGHNKHGPKI